jgi:hypothetical protein
MYYQITPKCPTGQAKTHLVVIFSTKLKIKNIWVSIQFHVFLFFGDVQYIGVRAYGIKPLISNIDAKNMGQKNV